MLKNIKDFKIKLKVSENKDITALKIISKKVQRTPEFNANYEWKYWKIIKDIKIKLKVSKNNLRDK